jgi:hypothetical protein
VHRCKKYKAIINQLLFIATTQREEKYSQSIFTMSLLDGMFGGFNAVKLKPRTLSLWFLFFHVATADEAGRQRLRGFLPQSPTFFIRALRGCTPHTPSMHPSSVVLFLPKQNETNPSELRFTFLSLSLSLSPSL